MRNVGQKYGLMCHWAKLELDDGCDDVTASLRERLGSKVIEEYNSARDMYDPKRVLTCEKLDKVFEKVA